MALPNPFQSTIVAPVVSPSIVKTAQNDTSFFHGYRSTFNIDQQKEQYQQQKNLQQQEHEQQHQQQYHYQQHPNNQNASKHQFNQFNRNFQHHRNHQPNRNAAATAPNHTPNRTANAGFVSNWCDLCERGFKFPHQLEKHRSEHEKCWFENCTFEGHTQLLKKHIEVQHQSGLFQRIIKVETDEDIEKWREERRKRYPTASNIEARRLAQEERLKRGERIDEPTSRFGNMNTRKRAQQHRSLPAAKPNESIEPCVTNDVVAKKRNDHKNRRRPRQRNKTNRLAKKERSECGKKNESETTQNEPTVTAMVNTETASCVATAPPAEKMAQNSSALAAIMGMYGSESDSNDEDDHIDDEVKTAVTMVTATDTTKMIEDKTDENVCQKIDPVDEMDKLTLTESNVTTEDTVNLKRPADSDVDELPNKQTKIDSDVIEAFKQNMAIESDDDAPDEQPIQRQSQVVQDTGDLELESGPTEAKPMTVATATSSQRLTNERIPKRKTVLDTTRKIRSQNTLLEKLLQKDIRHERNVLLQCVRYVVEQNFFGIGQTIDEQNKKTNSL